MPKVLLLLLVVLVSVGATFDSPEEASEDALSAYELLTSDSTAEFGHQLLQESMEDLAQFVADSTGATKEQLLEAWRSVPLDHQIAVVAAVGQVGKPYRYARSGPNAFDCSGLMAYAWEEAGETLSHSSRQQIREADDVWVPVAGDLVYYPGHIMMYLGVEDIVVHAANRRKGVTFGEIRRDVTFGRP